MHDPADVRPIAERRDQMGLAKVGMKIFFDVDGVVIEGWHFNEKLRKRWDATLEADLNIDSQAFRKLLFGKAADHSMSLMHECSIGRRDLKDTLTELLPKAGYHAGADIFMRYWFERDSHLNADVLDLIRDIRQATDATVYLATAQEHYRARYLWNDLGLSNHFDQMFFSAAIGYPKQDVRFFEAINRLLAIDGLQCPIFFDDRPDIVDTANRAGWDGTVFSSADDIRRHPRLRRLWP